MVIKTNNVPRAVIDAYELSAEERAEFDYIDWNDVNEGVLNPQFFRYKGRLYDLGEFMAPSNLPEFSPLKGWDGYLNDSFFSAIVVRYADDFEAVVVGLALS